MNRAEFQQTGGFPLETDTLTFMQTAFTALQSMVAFGGDNYILSGCVVNGTNVSNGFMVINGELLPFTGGLLQTKVVIRETPTGRVFENGSTKTVFYSRNAQFGTGNEFTLFADLVRIKDLKTFRNLPHQFSSAIDLDSESFLATSKAIRAVYEALKNQVPSGLIAMWKGSINTIPNGWVLCDGQNGTDDLRDKFIVGSGYSYAVDAQGGEARHTLTIEEIPSHSHDLDLPSMNFQNDGTGGPDVGKEGGDSRNFAGSIKSTGGGLSHNNLPPYWSKAFIQKL